MNNGYTKADLLERGVEERFIMDRLTHPDYHFSSWATKGRGDELLAGKVRYRFPHVNKQSILITVMSNMYLEGVWHRLQDMIRYTEDAGYTVSMEEIDDQGMMPSAAIGEMRASGAMMALDGGVEWCFMIDTDIWLEPDTLVKLLKWDRPIVFPLLIDDAPLYPGISMPLSSPALEPGQGLQPVVWGAESAMLFHVNVFNCLSQFAWMGHDYMFAQQLWHYGHRTYVDTETVVHCKRGPARHRSKNFDEFWDSRKEFHHKQRNEERDRKPPKDYDIEFGSKTVTEGGVYLAVDASSHRKQNGPNSGV